MSVEKNQLPKTDVEEFSVIEEIRDQVSLALPNTVMMMSNIPILQIVIVSHKLGETALAGMALGNVLSSCSTMLVMWGMVEAVGTLCSQSYGAQNGRLTGQLLQRSIVIISILSIPLAIVWIFTGPILMWLGQSPLLSMEAGAYNIVKTPVLFMNCTSACCVFYLNAQGAFSGVTFVSLTALVVGLGLLWLSTSYTQLRLVGVALTFDVSYLITMVGMIYLIWQRHTKAINSNGEMLVTWHGIDCPSMWTGWGEFIKLAVSCTIMSAPEVLLLEGLALVAGMLPNPVASVAATNACMTISCMAFMFPMSSGCICCTRVGNCLGAYEPDKVSKVFRASLIMALSPWLVLACVCASYNTRYAIAQTVLGSSSNSDGIDVADVVATTLVFCLFDNLFNSLKELQNGIIRGCGRQEVGVYASLFSYLVVALPAALALAFQWKQSWCPGVKGLFCGLTCGSFTYAVLNYIITSTIDYELECKRIAKIVNAGGKGSGKSKK